MKYLTKHACVVVLGHSTSLHYQNKNRYEFSKVEKNFRRKNIKLLRCMQQSNFNILELWLGQLKLKRKKFPWHWEVNNFIWNPLRLRSQNMERNYREEFWKRGERWNKRWKRGERGNKRWTGTINFICIMSIQIY